MLYTVENSRENIISRCFTNQLSQQSGGFSGDLLDQKSKSPLLPGGGGRGYK